MSETTSSYAKIYIGTSAAVAWATDAAALTAFEADTYTEITGVEDLGEFGDEANAVEITTLGDSRKRRLKGTNDAGTFDLVCIRNSEDAGQRAAVAAQKVKDAFNIKVIINDAPTGGTPSTFYFRAVVMSAKTGVTSADNPVKVTFSMAINTAILEVVAAAA